MGSSVDRGTRSLIRVRLGLVDVVVGRSSIELRRPRRGLVDCLVGWGGGEGDRLRVDRAGALASFEMDFLFDFLRFRGAGLAAVDFREGGLEAPADAGVGVAWPLVEAYLFLEGGLLLRAPRVVRLFDGGWNSRGRVLMRPDLRLPFSV